MSEKEKNDGWSFIPALMIRNYIMKEKFVNECFMNINRYTPVQKEEMGYSFKETDEL